MLITRVALGISSNNYQNVINLNMKLKGGL